MLVQQLLLEALESLVDDEFKMFKWYLSMDILDGCRPIPKARLQTALRIETVTSIIKSYGEESAVNISVDILKKMNFNSTAEDLKKAYAGGKTASPSTSNSAVAPPAAPAAMQAQQGGVIFAPTLAGGTSGTWNINIQK